MDKVKDFEALCATADYLGKLAVKRNGESVKTYCVKTRDDWVVVYDGLVEEPEYLDREFGKTCDEFYVLTEDEMALFHLLNQETIELLLYDCVNVEINCGRDIVALDVELKAKIKRKGDANNVVNKAGYFFEIILDSPFFGFPETEYYGCFLYPAENEMSRPKLQAEIKTILPELISVSIKTLVKHSITETIIS